MPDPQPAINAPQTRAAIFLVLALKPGAADAARVRSVFGDLDKLIRAVSARDSSGDLSSSWARVSRLGPTIWAATTRGFARVP